MGASSFRTSFKNNGSRNPLPTLEFLLFLAALYAAIRLGFL